MARPRKPTATLKKQGTYQPCRRPPNELNAEPGIPPCPNWLNARAKREWRRICGLMKDYDVIAEVDQVALEAYCAARATFQESGLRLEKTGWTLDTPNGTTIRNPDAIVHSDAHKRMMEAGRALGLSPQARTAISTMKGKDAKRSDKAESASILSLVG